MRAPTSRVLAVAGVAVTVALSTGAASARPATTPPVPEGSGYACEVTSTTARTIRCDHTSWGVRWGRAPHGTHDVGGRTGWSVSVKEVPDERLLGTWCDRGGNDYIAQCALEARGQLTIPDEEPFGRERDHLTAYPAGTPEFVGDYLARDQWLMSDDGSHGLTFQADGNLVLYGPGGQALWDSETYGNPGADFVLQDDGNAVIYAPDGRALWNSETSGDPHDQLLVRDDGAAVVDRADGTEAFTTAAVG